MNEHILEHVRTLSYKHTHVLNHMHIPTQECANVPGKYDLESVNGSSGSTKAIGLGTHLCF
jgi:hypothetical protein